eukprot:05816.XXX_61696_62735_1 [CDS] Oithona nana genome sequencing.
MSSQFLIEYLPDHVIFKILGYLPYDYISRIRIVNSFFNRLCKQHLNRGFYKVEKVQSNFLKDLKSKLPRRESARRNHPYARHCDILTAIDTRMNLLSMTFGKYMDANLCCFIPGKIIDEIYNVLNILRTNCETPRTYEVLQELRDISSMAMEHFDEKIVPGLLKKHQKETAATSGNSPPSSSSPLTPSRLLTSPAFLPSPASKYTIPVPLKSMRDELNAHKKKMSESLARQKITFKKAFRKQNEKIENLERSLSAQALLISSQTEMLKEMNKKLLESEQKMADYIHAKVRKRPASSEDEYEESSKKLKAA